MRIGLLLCDEVAPNYVDEHGTYLSMFERLLPNLELEPYVVYKNDFPNQVNVCDAYLVNGSRHSVYDDLDWIHRLKEFVCEIHRQDKPYVGVCFGHQLLAEALGGKVQKSTNGWSVGTHRFQINQTYSWMQPVATSANLLMMCQDQVDTLPPSGEIFAHTETCPVGMYLVRDNMLGIQAHPEFSREYDSALIQSRAKKIGAEKTKQGLESLSRSLDTQLIASWISNFLLEKCSC